MTDWSTAGFGGADRAAGDAGEPFAAGAGAEGTEGAAGAAGAGAGAQAALEVPEDGDVYPLEDDPSAAAHAGLVA
jgi:hypothetical protein